MTGLHGIGEGARCACGSGRAPTRACIHRSHVGAPAPRAGALMVPVAAYAARWRGRWVCAWRVSPLPVPHRADGNLALRSHARAGLGPQGPGSEHDAANLKPPSPQHP